MNNDDLMRAEMTALRAVVTGFLRHMRDTDPEALEQVLSHAAQDAIGRTAGTTVEKAAAIAEIGRLLGGDE